LGLSQFCSILFTFVFKMIKMENLISIRNSFNVAHQSAELCAKLVEETLNEKDFHSKGYHAAARMISTKFMYNPFVSIKIYNQAKKDLEKLIEENPNDIELHYIRYTIQKNTPRFIGYYKNLKEDREKLISYMETSNLDELTNHMLVFFKDTKDISKEELEEIEN
jgi:hypothetical protein